MIEYDAPAGSGMVTIHVSAPTDTGEIQQAMAKARELYPGHGIHVRGEGSHVVLDGGQHQRYAIRVPRALRAMAVSPPSRPWKRPRNRAERRAAGDSSDGV